MPGLAIALILGVLAYEFVLKQPAAPIRGTSAARAQTQTMARPTGAANVTSAISGAEKLTNGLLSLFKPAASSGRPTQSGFSQPSSQSVNTVTSPGGGTVTYNSDGTVTIDGFVYDQNGNLVEAGPMLPEQIQQSAPGDGTTQDIFSQTFLNDFFGGQPEGNQDAALAQDANEQPQIFDQNFEDTF